ncbi:MAG: hypothetical protein AseanaTS_06320 [Candidatus Pelagadaptatus aseana]|uniref:hypothetical protein n=1 Tax=Candidatus Pelagadaptatus aseana TaxID=3120508 RepID=UPI0039B1D167
MSQPKLLVNAFIAVCLVAVWGGVAWRYCGPVQPLTEAEVDRYLSLFTRHMMEVGIPDGEPEASLKQSLAELRHFAETDDGKPFYMINLMRWREQAVFREGIAGVEGVDVQEADRLYNEKLFMELLGNASHTAYLSSTLPNALNLGVSGAADHWGEVGIFRYSSRRDFFNMVSSDSYKDIMIYKMASMRDIALVPSQPHGLLFNPMPNIPVLLAAVFIIFYLLSVVVQLWSLARKA